MTEPELPLPAARLQQLLESYGADPNRWPPAEREAAALLARPEWQRAQSDAAWLDALLQAEAAPEPSAALRGRILAQRPQAPAIRGWRRLWAELGGLRITGPALACSLALGWVMGDQVVQPRMRADYAEQEVALADETADLIAVAQLDAGYEEFDR